MMIKKVLAALSLAAFCVSMVPAPADAASAITRIKDIAKVQGVRSNQLVGYGLVVGLAKTGDSNKVKETVQSIGNMLKAFGVQGGTLVQTPLKAGNGEVYAVAQGPVSTGGFMAGNAGNTAQKNFPTVGLTPNGAIVEKSVEGDLGQDGKLSLSLAHPDFTTAARMVQSINSQFGGIARASNPGRIDISIPAYYRGNVVGFIANLEDLPVVPDSVAKVVMNERTGTIVMGGNVSVDECAITQGGLSIHVTKNTDVSQPDPLTYGSTIVANNTNVKVKDKPSSTIVLPATANVSDIVGALNAVGATPRDTISILQAMKASGALHAELELI